MTFGERLKKVRKDNKLTLDKFGESIGVKKNTLSTAEHDKSALSNPVITSICREYNVNKEWLLEGIGEPYKSNSPEIEIAEFLADVQMDNGFKKRFVTALARLSEEEWEVVAKFASSLIDE